jgi:hypothetical protein
MTANLSAISVANALLSHAVRTLTSRNGDEKADLPRVLEWVGKKRSDDRPDR